MYCILEITKPNFINSYESMYGPYKDYESALTDVKEKINPYCDHTMRATCEHLGWKLTYKIVEINVLSEKEVYALN